MKNDQQLVWYQLIPYKSSEQKPEAMEQFITSVSGILTSDTIIHNILKQSKRLVLTIRVKNALIEFFIAFPPVIEQSVKAQLQISYPSASLKKSSDPFLKNEEHSYKEYGYFKQRHPSMLSLHTYKTKNQDLLLPIIGELSKFSQDEVGLFEIILTSSGTFRYPQQQTSAEGHVVTPKLEYKSGKQALKASLRIYVSTQNKQKTHMQLLSLAGTFEGFTHERGNKLSFKKPLLFSSKTLTGLARHTFTPFTSTTLSPEEVASLFHLPDGTTQQVRNIYWGGEAFYDAPKDLPVAQNLTEQEKLEVNFFAKTQFKNSETIFGIKNGIDRRKHMYLIGKTGVGKSTLLANMAISDIRKGHGVAIIDPHGELSEILLDYIPSERINDVCYLDPSNTERVFGLNPLEVKTGEQRELVASGVVSIFQKLYAFSWGPRLEYLLRNTILTLTQVPGSTMLDIPKLLTNDPYREAIVEKLDDKILKDFWKHEYAQFSEKFRQEAISPVLNKIGQFLSVPTLRTILSFKHSTIDLESLMNDGKIVILNLSAGKIGEDMAALLGALFISKFQLAAMKRAHIKEDERKDFYLYVDEFQNFSTLSFVKILSEARKYKLNVILANQYMSQLSEDIQSAILGNIGSLISFTVGSTDAKVLEKEFGGMFSDKDLVSLEKFAIAVRLSIDGQMSQPFLATTLPLPTKTKNQQRNKVIKVSEETYTKKRE